MLASERIASPAPRPCRPLQFAIIDKDASGNITKQELSTFVLMCMRLSRASPAVMEHFHKEVYRALDITKKYTPAERRACVDTGLLSVTEMLVDKFDVDGDGLVDKACL